MINILLMIAYVLLTVSGLILFKLGADSMQITSTIRGVVNFQISLTSLIGVGCYIGSFIIYLLLLSKNALSFLIPVMMGVLYISVLIASVLILKEKIPSASLIGCGLILFGIILIVSQGK